MTAEISYTLEEAIEKAKFGKFNFFMIFLCATVLLSGFLEANSINMILPLAQCELNLSNAHKGFLGSVGFIGIIMSSHFWGFMADTKGRRKTIIPALLLSFLCTLVSSVAKSFWFMAFLRFMSGFW